MYVPYGVHCHHCAYNFDTGLYVDVTSDKPFSGADLGGGVQRVPWNPPFWKSLNSINNSKYSNRAVKVKKL